ncbi:hypothetical protein Pth03_33120 [Planotetraspora thailandica]|uniref:Uncharacterized protein n=1 Tax=Planotetraspora thailandica TaxID=487172 RepID=A0A8J3V170_9ACTN|nr:hypothetical protein Pth03_33120 [Planotetraspora thailandica]
MRVERAATRSAGAPSKTIRPAVMAGAGAEVDDPVGVHHDRLVVLDDDDRLVIGSRARPPLAANKYGSTTTLHSTAEADRKIANATDEATSYVAWVLRRVFKSDRKKCPPV